MKKNSDSKIIDMFAVDGSENSEIGLESETVEVEKPVSTEENITLISEGIDSLDEKSETKRAIAKDLPKDALIRVKSLVFGELIFKSKTNQSVISWQDIGEVREMTLEQIIDMNNTNTDYLRKPYVVLLNADAAEYFGLSEIYKNLASVWNLQKVFALPEKAIEKTIEAALAVNLRDVLIAQVRKMYKKRTLSDVRVIQLLEKKLMIDILAA